MSRVTAAEAAAGRTADTPRIPGHLAQQIAPMLAAEVARLRAEREARESGDTGEAS